MKDKNLSYRTNANLKWKTRFLCSKNVAETKLYFIRCLILWTSKVTFKTVLFTNILIRVEIKTDLHCISFIVQAQKISISNSYFVRNRVHVQSVTKSTHLPLFEICFFRVYLRNHLNYEKNIYIYLHSCLKSFQMKK